MKRIAAVLVALAGAVFAVNGYRPFSKRGYGAGYAFGYGLLASELPLYGLAAHVAALAAVTPRRSPRTTVFTGRWLLHRGWPCWACAVPGTTPRRR